MRERPLRTPGRPLPPREYSSGGFPCCRRTIHRAWSGGSSMNDSLRWFGEHCYERPGKVPGMRGGVSLTAVRGLPVAELLGRLGAREKEIAASVRYRDFGFSADTASLRPCMY